MTGFIAEQGGVSWLTGHGTVRLNEAQVEQLLDIFAGAEGGAALFNALYEARADLAIAPLTAIPELRPLNVTIRALDPRIWAAVPASAEAA